MDTLVLCGGRGSRLGGPTEKPLVEIDGEPMLDRVRRALAGADRVDRVALATSPLAPRTARHVATTGRRRERLVETPGEGYVADLGRALRDPALAAPVLTVVADLPLLAPAPVDRVIEAYQALDAHSTDESGHTSPPPPMTVCVPTALKRALDVSADTTRAHGGRELAPTGINVVGTIRNTSERSGDDRSPDGGNAASTESGTGSPDERLHVTHDARLAVNVNRPPDVAVAERLAGARTGDGAAGGAD
jgi:adenosylcobinamide-phosphate guanylyltransferase